MAGFEVIIYGRFWVIAEGFAVGITTSFSSQILRSTEADLVVQSFPQLKSHLAEA
jgi:hypothetical protein